MAKLIVGVNDLATINPEVAKQWHPTKNGDLTPDQVMSSSDKKVWWLESYDVPDDYPVESLRGKHFDFEWEQQVRYRNRGRGNPFLSNQKICPGFNDLVTTNPELVKQWHPTKNGDLKPDQVMRCSNQNVWWLESYDVPDDYPVESLRGKHFDFEWCTKVSDRTSGCGNPFLSGRAVCPGFNDLVTTNPEVAKQWHPTKNGDLTPDQVTSGSNQKVWWLDAYDVPDDYPVESLRGKHFDFEWCTDVHSRTRGSGNPFLPPACSKQESFVYMWLLDNNIPFEHELSVELNSKNGRLDVYLPDSNIVIEIDGGQHFSDQMYNSRGGREFDDEVKNDNFRNEYCHKNGIKLLRLPYSLTPDIQIEALSKFVTTGKIDERVIAEYDKYDFSTYSDIARDMNLNSFTAKDKGILSFKSAFDRATEKRSAITKKFQLSDIAQEIEVDGDVLEHKKLRKSKSVDRVMLADNIVEYDLMVDSEYQCV